MNRKTRSFVQTINSKPNDEVIRVKRENRKDSVKKYHDRKSRNLSELDIEQAIFFPHVERQNWKWGEIHITQILGPNTYQVKGADGEIVLRNYVITYDLPKFITGYVNVSPIPAARQSTGKSLQNSQQRTPTPNLPALAGVEDIRTAPRIDHPPADAGEQASELLSN